jgi:hypothetical protein
MLLPSFIIHLLQLKSRGERTLTFFVVTSFGATTMPAVTGATSVILTRFLKTIFLLSLTRVWLFSVDEKESLNRM